MHRATRLVVATLSLATLVVSGCGAYPGAGGTALGLRGEHAGRGGFMAFKGAMHGPKGMGGKGGFAKGGFGLPLVGVELTDAQKTSLAAIMAKYKPAEPDQAALDARRAAAKARQDAIKAALTAATFDAAALKAALTPPADAPAGPRPDPAMLAEVRALLTDEQRATAIAKLKEAPAPKADRPAGDRQRPDFTARLAEKLTLTDAQKAKLAALEAARQAAAPEDRHAAHRDAMIKFLETGDTAGLTATPTRPAPPLDAIVAFVGSLDAAQRAKLGDASFLLGRGGFGGHHGRGGFGGHHGWGGFSGPHGWGGFGGPHGRGGFGGPHGRGGFGGRG